MTQLEIHTAYWQETNIHASVPSSTAKQHFAVRMVPESCRKNTRHMFILTTVFWKEKNYSCERHKGGCRCVPSQIMNFGRFPHWIRSNLSKTGRRICFTCRAECTVSSKKIEIFPLSLNHIINEFQNNTVCITLRLRKVHFQPVCTSFPFINTVMMSLYQSL